MASFFQFTQGSESRVQPADSSPLLGRFRAVPPRPEFGLRHNSQLGLLSDSLAAGRGSVHVGYGALIAAHLGDSDSEDECIRRDGRLELRENATVWDRLWQKGVIDLWVEPRQSAVKKVVDRWWSRYGLLVLMPAILAIVWCAIPFPQYPLPRDDDGGLQDPTKPRKRPGYGSANVEVNFWFFLFIYYGFYNATALIWITKVFNLYSLNWWPRILGFPVTVSLIAVISLAVPVPIYLRSETRFLLNHNTSWISWTFCVMAMPVAIAFLILMTNERHIGLRHSLSETQRIFTTSWWTGEPDTLPRPDRRRRNVPGDLWEHDVLDSYGPMRPQGVVMRRRWLPASFIRFLWLCVALFVGLMAYVLGEAYAELYLQTLPHNSLETVVEGERVGSYPLSWVFKLYFMLTYQTYVRALYARLRTPQQFIVLQILSSTSLVILTPLMMTQTFHKAMCVLGLNGQTYGSYQKLQTRNVFIRFLAENASMATFLGSVLVLHYGANKDVYPYFAFDRDSEPYNLNLTVYFSAITWLCELVASVAVRGLIRYCFKVDVGLEGKLDLAVWPELLPTCVAVMLHVLQNMMFSIIRLQFH
ncbi:hypothetical protein MY5147_007547 [Beauveria neobassiana]